MIKPARPFYLGALAGLTFLWTFMEFSSPNLERYLSPQPVGEPYSSSPLRSVSTIIDPIGPPIETKVPRPQSTETASPEAASTVTSREDSFLRTITTTEPKARIEEPQQLLHSATKNVDAIEVPADHPGVVPNLNQSTGLNLVRDRSVAFVHVGKNGGHTVREAYPRFGCRKFKKPDDPSLPDCLTNMHWRDDSPFSQQCDNEAHLFNWPSTEEMKTFTTFMWAIRNPMSRAISAYKYLHHDTPNSPFAKGTDYMKEMFYKKCFPTLQHFLQTLENATYPIDPTVQDELFLRTKRPSDHPQYCLSLATTVLKGKTSFGNKINIHLRFNYQWYYEKTVRSYPGREILAVRTEHLWDDFKHLDIATGGSGKFANHGSVANKIHGKLKTTTKDPTPEQLRALCCVLWEEIELYQEIVNEAENFPYSTKLETMQDVWSTCSIDDPENVQYQLEGFKGNGQTVQFSWSKWSEDKCSSSGSTQGTPTLQLAPASDSKPLTKTVTPRMEDTSSQQKGAVAVTTKAATDARSKVALSTGGEAVNLANVTRKVVFVHVGKAGGHTVREGFGRLSCRKHHQKDTPDLQSCFEKQWNPYSPFAQQTDLEVHLFDWPRDQNELSEYSTFMWAIRNPVGRAISAYSYLHPNTTSISPFARSKHPLKEKYYEECFPALQDMLQTLTSSTQLDKSIQNDAFLENSSPSKHPQYCKYLAITVLKGKRDASLRVNVHLRFNYDRYYAKTVKAFPGKEILAIRTEHMWDDMKALDIATGGPGFFPGAGTVANKNRENTKRIRKDPTPEQLRALCCVLWEEIELYQEIVNEARNFPYSTKLETMQDLWSTCGINNKERSQYQAEDLKTHWSQWHQEQCPAFT